MVFNLLPLGQFCLNFLSEGVLLKALQIGSKSQKSLKSIALRLEAVALRLEAIALRLEAIALRLEAIALRLEAIAMNVLEATLGPIRDESQRLSDALAIETQKRQLQDQQRVPCHSTMNCP